MDYGKLAYLKATDLESRLGASGERKAEVTRVAAIPLGTAYGNEVELGRISGAGVTAFIVTAELKTATAGTIELFADERLLASEPLVKSEHLVKVITCAAVTGGGERVFLKVNASASVISASLTAIGASAVERNFLPLRAADSPLGYAVLAVEDGEIRLFFENARHTFDAYLLIGFGKSADITAINYGGKNGFAVAYADEKNNVWLTRVIDGAVSEAELIASGRESVAITSIPNGLAAAFSSGGAIGIRRLYGEDDGEIESVKGEAFCFVKEAVPPAFCWERNGKVYLKTAADELSADGNLGLNLTVSAE